MGKYNYTDREKDFNKVLKMNQNESFSLKNNVLLRFTNLTSI